MTEPNNELNLKDLEGSTPKDIYPVAAQLSDDGVLFLAYHNGQRKERTGALMFVAFQGKPDSDGIKAVEEVLGLTLKAEPQMVIMRDVEHVKRLKATSESVADMVRQGPIFIRFEMA